MSFRKSSLQSGKQERDAELAEVEKVLAAVCEGIDKLEEESREAKKEIAEVFSRQLTHLHSRQTQLLRQVDIVCRSRGELLHSQLAHTHRLLGALQTTHRWTEKLQQHKSDLTTQIISNLKKGNILSSLNLSLDEEALNAAIAGFGYVDMDGIFLMGGAEKSRCLPASVEEYLEDDQNVMEKSLHSNVIDMKFPKLPKDYTYWLSCNNKKKEDQPATETGYGPYRKALDSYKPCNVQTWLGCIQNETAAEPVDQAGDFSPELVSLSDSVSLCSSKQSDSIEIVSTCSLKSDEEKVDKCCQKPLINVEIENLADKLSVCMTDKQRWLAPTRTKLVVETMCRANELCKPDEKCLFENNCATIKLSPQHKNQTNKLDNQDFRKWLRPKSSTPSLAQAVRPPPPSSDYTKWLRPSASSKIKDDVNEQLKKNNVPVKRPMLPALSGHSWLRSKKPMISLNATTPLQLNKTTPDEWHRWLSRID